MGSPLRHKTGSLCATAVFQAMNLYAMEHTETTLSAQQKQKQAAK